MKEHLLVSIGLPAYKAKFLKVAVESILKQSYCNFELIIVDDDSPENLLDIISLFDDSRIRYYRNSRNLGGINLVDNWNKCLEYANGDYFVLASDDDVYERTFLEKMIGLSIKYPKLDVFHCRIGVINENNEIKSISNPCLEYETDVEFIYQRLINRRLQVVPDFLVRTSVLKRIGGYVSLPLAWYSDDATFYKLCLGKGVGYSNEILFWWRSSGQNISSRVDNIEQKLQASIAFSRWINELLIEKEIPQSDLDKYFFGQIKRYYLMKIKDQVCFDLFDMNPLPFLSMAVRGDYMKWVGYKELFKVFLLRILKKR